MIQVPGECKLLLSREDCEDGLGKKGYEYETNHTFLRRTDKIITR